MSRGGKLVSEPEKKAARNKIIQKVAFALLFVGAAGLTMAGLGVLSWLQENGRTEAQIARAEELAQIIETDTESEIVEQAEDPDEDNPYWAFIKMNLYDVNLTDLIRVNDEVQGWIQVPGTNVNYPFMQHSDNDYYLKHSFDQSYNNAGWVFLDYRNKTDLSDQNNILYAHGRVDTTMFGGLRHILYNGWLSDRANFMVRTSTQKENGIWQIFSVYHLPTTTDYLQTNFKNGEEYGEFLKTITERSAYNFNAKPSIADRIITLSTCYSDTERMVIHAKLIKYN